MAQQRWPTEAKNQDRASGSLVIAFRSRVARFLSPSASVPVCVGRSRERGAGARVCASWDFIICLRRAVKSAEAYFCVLHQEIRATLENCS